MKHNVSVWKKKKVFPFPERGHSYLECNKNMGNFNLKTKIGCTDDWYDLLWISRINPSPFMVEQVTQNMIWN